MTISSLLNDVRSESDRYGQHLWNHRLSGNTLELTVRSPFESRPEEYRESVIKVGQVLKAIKHHAIRSGQNIQINSFPDLGKSQLIALVKLPSGVGLNNSHRKTGEADIDHSCAPLILMKSVASHYGLFFNTHTGTGTDRIIDLMKKDGQSVTPEGSYHSLCSIADNPFVWIKAGQWIERVLQLIGDNSEFPQPSYTYKIVRSDRSSLDTAFTDCPYIQVLVQIDHRKAD